MEVPIKNSWDLRQEIIRLKELEQEQSLALKERFSSPMAVFSTVYSIFPKSSEGEHKTNIFNQDYISIISRFLIPLTLNKTLFKNSGFIIKALVGMVSQKASGYINEGSVYGVWDKVKSLFSKKGSKVTVQEKYPYSL
jgi:hypothetical protein